MKTTYLCGPINGCTDEEASDWRNMVKPYLNGDTIDPMRRDYRGVEQEQYQQIVELDKVDVAQADVILASVPKPSVGTSMEILYAWQLGKLVVLVFPDHEAMDGCSPWLRYHAHAMFRSYLGAARYINGLD